MYLSLRTVIRKVRNRAFIESGCQTDPTATEMANRAYRYFESAGVQMVWGTLLDEAEAALKFDKKPTRVAFCRSQKEKGEKGTCNRWSPTARARATRNQLIVKRRSSGQSCRSLASDFGLTERQIRRICQQPVPKFADIRHQPPGPTETRYNNSISMSSTWGTGDDGECPTDDRPRPSPGYEAEWEDLTGLKATTRLLEQMQMWEEWVNDDPLDAADPDARWRSVQRIILIAATKKHPKAYAISSMDNLMMGETVSRMENAVSEVAYEQSLEERITDRRAYLAVCSQHHEGPTHGDKVRREHAREVATNEDEILREEAEQRLKEGYQPAPRPLLHEWKKPASEWDRIVRQSIADDVQRAKFRSRGGRDRHEGRRSTKHVSHFGELSRR